MSRFVFDAQMTQSLDPIRAKRGWKGLNVVKRYDEDAKRTSWEAEVTTFAGCVYILGYDISSRELRTLSSLEASMLVERRLRAQLEQDPLIISTPPAQEVLLDLFETTLGYRPHQYYFPAELAAHVISRDLSLRETATQLAVECSDSRENVEKTLEHLRLFHPLKWYPPGVWK